MRKIYLFLCSLALIMIAFSPANAQRKNTTKHDIAPVNMMEVASQQDKTDCHKIKEQCKKCKHMKKEWKKEHKKDKKEHHKKHHNEND